MNDIQAIIERFFPRLREVYISPLSSGDDVIKMWQVELNISNGEQVSFAGKSIREAAIKAVEWLETTK